MLRSYPISIIFSGVYGWAEGGLSMRGTGGRYWSSTPSTQTNSSYLYFVSSGVTPQSGYNKTGGFTVRCVARGEKAETVEEEDEVATTCEAGKICYDSNGGSGSMSDQSASANTSTMLTAPTFNKIGYAFVGWNTQENGFGTTYQADETITTPSTLSSTGLQLYAKWLPSAGEMQNWSGCSALGEHQTVALTDNRDGKTYAVRKLKDGNCWMVNNLNLELADFAGTHKLTKDNTDLAGSGRSYWDPSESTIAKYQSGETFSDFTLRVLGQSQPAQFQSEDQTGYYWGSKKSDDGNYTDLSSLANNTNAEMPRSYNAYENGYYNWYAATAESGTYSMTSGNASDSLCPKGWQLPENDGKKSWNNLIKTTYGYITTAGSGNTDGSKKMRGVPLSIIFSGHYHWVNARLNNRGTGGYYWSASPYATTYSNNLNFDSSYVSPQDGVDKTHGLTVRCVARD